MPSSSIRRLDISAEASYMNRDPATGEPSLNGITWLPCEIADATQITAIGDTTTTAVNTSTGGFGTQPGDPLLNPNSNLFGDGGQPIKSGTLTVDFYLRSGASDEWFAPDQATKIILTSRLGFACNDCALSSSSAMTTGGQITLPSAPAKGDVIAYSLPDGRMSYGFATSAAVSQVLMPGETFSAAYTAKSFSRSSGGDIYETVYEIPSVGGDPIAYGEKTFALRITGDGWQQLAFGCAMTALSITAEAEGRAIRCSATIDCPFTIDVDQNDIATPDWPFATGVVLHSLGSPFVVGDLSSGDAATNWDSAYCVSAWTLNLNWTTSGAACGSYWSGRAPLEATSLDASLELTIGHPSAASRQFFAEAWESQKKLQVILPFGGNWYTPSGGCIAIPAAYVTDGAVTNPDLSADAIQTQVTLGLSNDPDAVFDYLLRILIF